MEMNFREEKSGGILRNDERVQPVRKPLLWLEGIRGVAQNPTSPV